MLPMPAQAKRKRVSGTINWCPRGDEKPVDGQYIPDKKIELSFEFNGNRYRVALAPPPTGSTTWIGSYVVNARPPQQTTAKLYTAPDGSMVLLGEWREETYDYSWVVEFGEDDEDET